MSDHAELAAPGADVEGGEVEVVVQHAATPRLVKTKQQMCERGLARAGPADDRDGFAGVDVHAHVVDDERPAGGVAE